MANLVDTGVNGDLRVTGNIYGNVSGNATTATTWATGREFKIQDADATNTGTTVTGVNGSGNVTLQLPSTIKATLTGNATTCTYPYGFASRNTSNKWGTLSDSTYTWVTDWRTSDNSEIAFGSKSGQLSAQIDGYFYQREGNNRVLDTLDGMACGLCGTAAGTAAKVANAVNYTASVGNTILVRFANTNSAAGALTLNLGGVTKTIKWNGTVTASGATSAIPAGTWPCYYDGTYWNIWTNGAVQGNSFMGGVLAVNDLNAGATKKTWSCLGKIKRTGFASSTWGSITLILTHCAGISGTGNKYSVDNYIITFQASASDFSGKVALLNNTDNSSKTYATLYTKYDSTTDSWILYASCATDKNYSSYQIYELTSTSSVDHFRYSSDGCAFLDAAPTDITEITGHISALFPKAITTNQVVLTDGTTGMLKTSAASSLSVGSATKATQDSDGKQINSTYLKLSGGTMTGKITAQPGQYTDDNVSCAINMNNSNIIGLNSIYTADASEGASEGIHFYRDATHVDTLWMASGALYFVPNRALGTSTSAADSQKVARLPASITDNQVVFTNGTAGVLKTNTLDGACNLFINALSTGSSTPTDNDYYVSQYVGGGTTTTSYHRRPVSALWTYIKGKMTSVSDVDISGNAATASKLQIPRKTGSSTNINSFVSSNRCQIVEFGNDVTNRPADAWTHVISMQGEDPAYATQIAVGMTTGGLWYRNMGGSAWNGWTKVATSTHAHGNITNGGAITATGVALASGDSLVFVDSSDSSLVKKTSIIFDGSTTTKALTQKGTWETFNNYSLPLAASGTRGGIQIGYSESGTNYAVKLSSEKAYVTVPWTDTKQRIVTSDSKTYLTGVTTAPTSSNQDLTGVANTNVYATAGQLHATTFDVNSKCTLQFNTTTNALDFVFA